MPRILVVDDEPHVTRLVQQRLRAEGYEAVTASHGMGFRRSGHPMVHLPLLRNPHRKDTDPPAMQRRPDR